METDMDTDMDTDMVHSAIPTLILKYEFKCRAKFATSVRQDPIVAQNARSKNATTSFAGKLNPRRYMLESMRPKIAEQLKRNCNSAVINAARPLIAA